MIAMIGTSDRLCWLAESCEILLLLLHGHAPRSTLLVLLIAAVGPLLVYCVLQYFCWSPPEAIAARHG